MHVAPLVEDGELIREVRRTGPDQLRHKRRLPGQAPSRQENRPSLPLDHARVDEDLPASALADEELHILLEGIQEEGPLRRLPEQHGVRIEEIELTGPSASVRARDDDRIGVLDLALVARRPAERQPGPQVIESLGVARPDADQKTVRMKGEACRPPEAVNLLHSSRRDLVMRNRSLGHLQTSPSAKHSGP